MKRNSPTVLLFAVLAFAASLALAGQTPNLPFGTWSRVSSEPILSPQDATWESAGTFNPAVILHNGKIVMLYRAQDAAGTSRRSEERRVGKECRCRRSPWQWK